MLDNTLTLILAGGVGSRLKPLTAHRSKPAVPFGGKYRIIDFCLANCLHSGLRRVLVLTQYKSLSLQKHLRDGWSIFNPELGEYITPIPPQMQDGERFYSGTADAIYQNLYLLERNQADHVLILSADHIYRMDYAAMLEQHVASGADVTIACMETSVQEAVNFGVMRVDDEGRIVDFHEKPETPATLPDEPAHSLVSMGIYLFRMDLLQQVLMSDHAAEASNHDFGQDIIPALIGARRVMSYRFGGAGGRVSCDRYWRDVGTLDAYYQANMDLLEAVPPLDLYQPDWAIRTHQKQAPPARTVPGASGSEGIFINSIIAGGSVISGGSVQHSILFPRVFVGDEAVVEQSILFEGVKVGAGARLLRVIVDRDVQIPPGEHIGYDLARDRQRFTVSEQGVVVVPRGYRFEGR